MTKKSKAEPAEAETSGFTIDYCDILDVVEKKFKLSANMQDRFSYAVSTGLLVNDLILGGGLVFGGMYTIAGQEQSAKSTTVMTFLKTLLAIEDFNGIIIYQDAEGSFDSRYFEQMGDDLPKGTNLTSVFGVKNSSGKYVVKPRVRYYPDNRGEVFMSAMGALLNRLPDKELIDGQWYFVYENTNENRKKVSGQYSKALFTKHNKFFVPTTITSPQAIICVDSWPSLLTERGDDEDASEGLGAQARMFSEYLPKMKGKLRRKAVILLGINQLREKPMARGNPFYEPGGNALKFWSDVRVWQTPRAVPHASGQLEEEDSVTCEGVDTYRYIHIKTVKNKLSTPYLEGWSRLWVSDGDGVAHGIDPVWDTLSYLRMTGQASGTMKKLSIHMKGKDGFALEKISFLDFKGLILLKGKALKEWCSELGLTANPRLRERCFEQLRAGQGVAMYFDALKPDEGEEEEEEGDEEEYDE